MHKLNNINDFKEHLIEKNVKQCETFKIIMNKCFTKMKLALEKGYYGIYYEVPEFIIGRPVYKLEDCVKYVLYGLKLKGFCLKYYHPHVIYISWDNIQSSSENEQQKLKYEEPIVSKDKEEKTVVVKEKTKFNKNTKQNKNSKLVLNV